MSEIVILDCETTGIDEGAVCIEVALCVYSLTHAAVIDSYSSLIRADANPAESINRISPALLADAPEAEQIKRHDPNLATPT